MNLKRLKYILSKNIKPFQMTTANIKVNKDEVESLQSIAENIDNNPGEASFQINQLSFLSEYVDYIKTFHKVGKGDLSNKYQQNIPTAKINKDLLLDYHVGIIADTFLYDALEGACNLQYINENGQDGLYDFVIIASTWRGIDGYWQGITNTNGQKFEELKQFVHTLQKKNIPIVFFNKEDPVNFEIFKEHAKLIRNVITTEVSYVEKYKNELKLSNVSCLQFPINPRIHNPIGIKENLHHLPIAFAGSWIEKYDERNKDAEQIFDGVIESSNDLTIFDRNLWLNQSKYQFPAKYLEYIAAPLEHKDTMMMHKTHPFAINLNTIKYSNSMCANRAFELQAMGNLLLSNYNTFINMYFPQIQIIFDSNDVAQTVQLDDLLLQRARALGIQEMMLDHNHFKWLQAVAEFLNIKTPASYHPDVTIIVEENDLKVLKQIKKQTYQRVKIVHNQEHVSTPYFTYMSNDYHYDGYYLENLISATVYADVDFITINHETHQFVTDYNSKYTTLFKRGIKAYQEGYSLDKTYIINPINKSEHDKKKLSVIIPVYNNGKHLEHKCLRSIIRNKDFESFEIILVNDGSTDQETLNILEFFSDRYENIRLIHLEQPSGSASVPRNVGVKHAKCEYITFLDPDNEWIGHGINELLETIKADNSIDMVVGNMLKVDNEKTQIHNYYHYFTTIAQANTTQHTKQLLIDTKLKTASIQALIVKKSLITQHHIEMVPGALGQDSLYFLQLMNHATCVKVVDTTVHVYYAAVTNSMTNTISESFFEKYLLIEKARLQFLKQHHLLSVYMQHRFNYYMKNWYISRLKRDNYRNKAAIKRFLEIYQLYKNIDRPKDESLKKEIQKLKSEV
ncbi:glycosyltransferase [Staphylococcus sp. 11261D007BR]